MKELVSFSLKRRFMNSATILLNVLLWMVVCGVLFADKIVDVINPTMFDKQIVYMNIDPIIEETLNNMEQSGFEFIHEEKPSEELIEKTPKAYVLEYKDQYVITSCYQIPNQILEVLQNILQNIHQDLSMSEFLTIEEMEQLKQPLMIQNEMLNDKIKMNSDKQNLVFMVITSIYFTMLSFSTTVANEVIYEKSTRQLELILTSVSAKVHFYSKMLVGWLAIIIQALSLGSYVLLALLLRNFYDQGVSLIALINKIQFMVIQEKTIGEFLSHLTIETDFICKLGFIFLFLMMGILLLQMVLVVVSSFIANIEEAGNVQGPFYLILLGIYYFAISINTPYQMSEGIGFYCSFLPFLNMLFMPCRLLLQNVNILELCLSAMISIIFMSYILTKGPLIYQRGVLDYSSKGFLGVMKKTLGKENR